MWPYYIPTTRCKTGSCRPTSSKQHALHLLIPASGVECWTCSEIAHARGAIPALPPPKHPPTHPPERSQSPCPPPAVGCWPAPQHHQTTPATASEQHNRKHTTHRHDCVSVSAHTPTVDIHIFCKLCPCMDKRVLHCKGSHPGPPPMTNTRMPTHMPPPTHTATSPLHLCVSVWCVVVAVDHHGSHHPHTGGVHGHNDHALLAVSGG